MGIARLAGLIYVLTLSTKHAFSLPSSEDQYVFPSPLAGKAVSSVVLDGTTYVNQVFETFNSFRL